LRRVVDNCTTHRKQREADGGTLADVLTWLQSKGYSLAKGVLDVARVALQVNVAKEGRRLPRATSKELDALIG
jgi:hypothetical protein